MSERSSCNYSFLLVQSVHVNSQVIIMIWKVTFFWKFFQTWQNIFFFKSEVPAIASKPGSVEDKQIIKRYSKVQCWTCTICLTLAVQLSNDSHVAFINNVFLLLFFSSFLGMNVWHYLKKCSVCVFLSLSILLWCQYRPKQMQALLTSTLPATKMQLVVTWKW